MSHKYEPVPEGKDPGLWKIAQKRAGFKYSLITYIIVNIFLWCIWYFSGNGQKSGFPWPLWVSLGWGIGIAFSYARAYIFTQDNAVEIEYEKLKNKQ